MHREVFAGRDAAAADGRRDARRDRRGGARCSPTRRAREVDMVFQFEHVGLDQGADASGTCRPLRLRDLKASLRPLAGRARPTSAGTASTGTTTTSRGSVSRFGDDGRAPASRSAKMLGTVLHLHRGTPYVYQGEELGMTNVAVRRDRRLPRHRVAQPLRRGGRRAARTPDDVLAALRHDEPRQRPHADAVGRARRTPASPPATPWIAGQPQPRRDQRRGRSATTPTRSSTTTAG